MAIVSTKDGAAIGPDELLAVCARHLARYKLPKAFLFVPEVHRNPNGKADYRWAAAQACDHP